MEGKHEEFWKQGDFGYVKKEIDSMMVLCKAKKKVPRPPHTHLHPSFVPAYHVG